MSNIPSSYTLRATDVLTVPNDNNPSAKKHNMMSSEQCVNSKYETAIVPLRI